MSEELVVNEIENSDLSQDPQNVVEHYARLKLLVESLESDVLKSQKGNKAAGTRLRKSLRHLKQVSSEFVKFSLGK